MTNFKDSTEQAVKESFERQIKYIKNGKIGEFVVENLKQYAKAIVAFALTFNISEKKFREILEDGNDVILSLYREAKEGVCQVKN